MNNSVWGVRGADWAGSAPATSLSSVNTGSRPPQTGPKCRAAAGLEVPCDVCSPDLYFLMQQRAAQKYSHYLVFAFLPLHLTSFPPHFCVLGSAPNEASGISFLWAVFRDTWDKIAAYKLRDLGYITQPLKASIFSSGRQEFLPHKAAVS